MEEGGQTGNRWGSDWGSGRFSGSRRSPSPLPSSAPQLLSLQPGGPEGTPLFPRARVLLPPLLLPLLPPHTEEQINAVVLPERETR